MQTVAWYADNYPHWRPHYDMLLEFLTPLYTGCSRCGVPIITEGSVLALYSITTHLIYRYTLLDVIYSDTYTSLHIKSYTVFSCECYIPFICKLTLSNQLSCIQLLLHVYLQVIADSLSGLLFKNKRDRKMVCVDPKVCDHLCAYVNAGNLSFSCIICYPFASASPQLMQCYASTHHDLVMEGIKPYIQSTTVLSESMCTTYVEGKVLCLG